MAVQAKFTIVTDASQVTSGLRQVNGALNETGKKTESVSTSMAKGFIKAELAMRAVRVALKFAVDGLKEFEKETGKTQGLTETTKLIKNLQIQVADMLAPALQDLAKQSNENFNDIAKSVRTATAVFINFFGAIKIGVDVLILGVALLGVTWTASIIGIINVTQALVDLMARVPGPQQKIFKAISEGQEAMANKLRGIRDGLFDVGNQAREEIKKTANDMANTEMRIGEVSGVRTGGADARKKAEDDAKKAAEEAHRQMQLTIAQHQKDVARIYEIDKDAYSRYIELIKDTTTKEFTFIDIANASKMEKYALYREQTLKASQEQYNAEGNMLLRSHLAANALLESEHKSTLDSNSEYNAKLAMLWRDRGESSLKIEEFYDGKLNDMYKEFMAERMNVLADMQGIHQEVLRTSYEGQLKLVDEYETRMVLAYWAANQKKLITDAEFSTAIIDLTKYTEEQRTQIIMSNVAQQVDLYAGMAQEVNQIFTNLATMQINQLQRARKAEIKSVEQSTMSAKEKAEKIDEINAEMDAKIREQKKKQQNWAIASALISGAVASMSNWESAMKLGYPANIIVGAIGQALIAALTATEVGIIASQEFARGGVVAGNPAAGDVQNAKLTGGEVVLNKDQQARTLMAIANGGRSSNAPSIRGGDTYVTIQGNADEAILAEALRRSRTSQMQDMKQLLRQMQFNGSLRVAVA